MNLFIKTIKIVLFVPIILLLSSCRSNNQSINTEGSNSQTITPNTQCTSSDNQTTSSSTQTKNTTEEANLDLFSGVNDYAIVNLKTYYNDNFELSVDYPGDWDVYAEESKVSDENSDGDPQNGIFLYADSIKDESIYVFHQMGHIVIPSEGYTTETFLTAEGVMGQILYEKSENEVTLYLVLGSGFNGVIIKMSDTAFEKYIGQIYGILKSIKISEIEK